MVVGCSVVLVVEVVGSSVVLEVLEVEVEVVGSSVVLEVLEVLEVEVEVVLEVDVEVVGSPVVVEVEVEVVVVV